MAMSYIAIKSLPVTIKNGSSSLDDLTNPGIYAGWFNQSDSPDQGQGVVITLPSGAENQWPLQLYCVNKWNDQFNIWGRHLTSNGWYQWKKIISAV